MAVVNYQVRDSWNVKPPCMLDQACPSDCPYYLECWGDEGEDETED